MQEAIFPSACNVYTFTNNSVSLIRQQILYLQSHKTRNTGIAIRIVTSGTNMWLLCRYEAVLVIYHYNTPLLQHHNITVAPQYHCYITISLLHHNITVTPHHYCNTTTSLLHHNITVTSHHYCNTTPLQ